MVAQFNIKIDGVWYKAGEEIPEKKPVNAEKPKEVEEPKQVEDPVNEPEQTPSAENEQKPRRTSTRRKVASE